MHRFIFLLLIYIKFYSQKYFVFEKTCSLSELLKESIAIRVVQKKILCRNNQVIGELEVDMYSVWEAKSIFKNLFENYRNSKNFF